MHSPSLYHAKSLVRFSKSMSYQTWILLAVITSDSRGLQVEYHKFSLYLFIHGHKVHKTTSIYF